MDHQGHDIFPHAHVEGKTCSGRFFCVTCGDWLTAEKCKPPRK